MMRMSIKSERVQFSGVYSVGAVKGISDTLAKTSDAIKVIDVSVLEGAGAPLFALFLQLAKRYDSVVLTGASSALVDMAKLYGVDQVLEIAE